MRLAGVERPAVSVSLTALIDVVFILLFFFMLASRSLDWRTIEVNLSILSAAERQQTSELAIALLVLPDGTFHDGEQEISAKQLSSWIDATPKSREIILVSAPSTSAQVLLDALDQVRSAERSASIARVPRP